METYDEIREIVKMKLEVIDHASFSDSQLDLLIEEAEVKILNYINQYTMPKQAYYTWANIVVDYIHYLDYIKGVINSAGNTVPNVSGVAKSIKDGDSTVEFFQSIGNPVVGARRNLSWDDLLFDYKSDLMEFRALETWTPHYGKRYND